MQVTEVSQKGVEIVKALIARSDIPRIEAFPACRVRGYPAKTLTANQIGVRH